MVELMDEKEIQLKISWRYHRHSVPDSSDDKLIDDAIKAQAQHSKEFYQQEEIINIDNKEILRKILLKYKRLQDYDLDDVISEIANLVNHKRDTEIIHTREDSYWNRRPDELKKGMNNLFNERTGE